MPDIAKAIVVLVVLCGIAVAAIMHSTRASWFIGGALVGVVTAAVVVHRRHEPPIRARTDIPPL